MSTRRTVSWIAALMAAVVVGGSPARVAAQGGPPSKVKVDTSNKRATPDTSTKRIKIQKETKEAAGEVCLPAACPPAGAIDELLLDRERYAREAQRVLDSIDASVRLEREITRMRNEASVARERAWRDSVERAEAAERAALLARRRHLARGFYIGAAGGASMPERDVRNGYTGGWNATVPLGWDANESPLGFRVDAGVDHLNGTRVHDANNATTAASGDITIWSLNADVKLRAHAPGGSTRTHVYALGGIGAHRVTNGVYGVSGLNAGRNLSFNNASTNFGWNVGAGLSAAWGPTELFIESRFFQIKSDLGYHQNGGIGTYTSFTPIVVGLQWF